MLCCFLCFEICLSVKARLDGENYNADNPGISLTVLRLSRIVDKVMRTKAVTAGVEY